MSMAGCPHCSTTKSLVIAAPYKCMDSIRYPVGPCGLHFLRILALFGEVGSPANSFWLRSCPFLRMPGSPFSSYFWRISFINPFACLSFAFARLAAAALLHTTVISGSTSLPWAAVLKAKSTDLLFVTKVKQETMAALRVLIAASFIGASSHPNNPLGIILALMVFSFF